MKFYDFTDYDNLEFLPFDDKSLYSDFVCSYRRDFNKNFQEQKNSVTVKNTFRNEMKDVLTNDAIDREKIHDMYHQMFFVPDLNEGAMTRGRFGYLFGYEVVESIAGKHDMNALLNLSPESFLSYIDSYFNDI